MSETRFRIKRFDPASDTAPRYDEFMVPYEGSLTVLEGLFSIQEHHDGSLCFRYCCRAAVCGSCAMYINGPTASPARPTSATCRPATSRSSPCRTCRWSRTWSAT